MKFLNLMNAEINNIEFLSVLHELERIDLEGTPVSDVAPLASLKKLRALDLQNTKVKDISALSNLGALIRHSIPDARKPGHRPGRSRRP